MIKYRVKMIPKLLFFGEYNNSTCRVQAKYKFIPIWISISRGFNTEREAFRYIDLIQDVK